MEHDIRELFKKEEFEKKKLPEFHQEEFIQKLKKSSTKNNSNYFSSKVVAFFILMLIGVSFYFTFNTSKNSIEKSSIFVQVEKIEKEYEANIDKEWQKFIKITDDKILINKYEYKLQQLKTDYKKLTLNLAKNPNNILVLESLIENLQRRLELVKDIKEHIKELNQKNTSNETIYL